MEKKYVLVIDEGTTGLRAHLFNKNMKVIGQHYEKINSYYPVEKAVQQNPMEIYKSTVRAIRTAVNQAGIAAEEIQSIAITAQRGSFTFWNKKTGQPLYDTIVWHDTRGLITKDKFANDAEFCKQHPRMASIMEYLAFNPFTIIDLLLQENPELKAAMKDSNTAWGLIDSWLFYKLSGGKVHATCASMASASSLYSFNDRNWDFGLLPYISMRDEMMPEIKNEIDDYGMLDKEILGVEIPIVASIADQQASLFGEGCHEAGSVKCTIGTGAFICVNVGKNRTGNKNFYEMCAWRFDGEDTYEMEGFLPTAGACLEWGKNNLNLISDFETMNTEAESVPNSCGVYFVPAISGMDGMPFNNPTGRASFMGISANSKKPHFIRAMIEGIAYSMVFMFEHVVNSMPGIKMELIMLDGGVSRNDLLCQTIATLTGATVVRPLVTEATAMGAAELAAISAKWFQANEVRRLIKTEHEFQPITNEEQLAEAKKQYSMWQKAVERSKDWIQ